MISVLNETTLYKTAFANIKSILQRSKCEVSVGFDFVKLANRKCTHYIYVDPNRIQETFKLFRDFDLICLRFCEVV